MHIYECEDGTKVPSVTTVLKILSSESLIHWANFIGFRHIRYEDEMERTAINGTYIHQVAQSVVDPSAEVKYDFAGSNQEGHYLAIGDKFKKFISSFSYETIFTEKTLISKDLGYGGTIDWYAKLAGLYLLNDFKSSKTVRLKHLLQLGGYYGLMKEFGYDVSGGSIIIVNANECSMYPIKEEVLIEMHSVFKQLVIVYKALEGGEYLPKKDMDFLKLLTEKA